MSEMLKTLQEGLPKLGLPLDEDRCRQLCAFGEAVVEHKSALKSVKEKQNLELCSNKEIYVEGYEDELFYRKFLAKIYDCSTLNTDFVVCHNKDSVLLSSKKYDGTKKKFIVDLDYLPFDREKYNNLAKEYGNQYVFDILSQVDKKTANKLHPNDTVRVIRALEIF